MLTAIIYFSIMVTTQPDSAEYEGPEWGANSAKQLLLSQLKMNGVEVFHWQRNFGANPESITFRGKKFNDASLDLLRGLEDAQPRSVGSIGTSMSSVGIARLAKFFPTISHISITNANLQGNDFEGFPKPKQLTGASLNGSTFDEEFVHLFLANQPFTVLSFMDTNIDDEGVKLLEGSRDIYWLGLGRTRVTAACIQSICELNKLESLILNDTPIDDLSLALLLKCPNLRTLRIDGTNITDAAFHTLARMPKLYDLNLSRTAITLSGLQEIQNHPTLWSLQIDDTAITREQHKEFHFSLPAVKKALKVR